MQQTVVCCTCSQKILAFLPPSIYTVKKSYERISEKLSQKFITFFTLYGNHMDVGYARVSTVEQNLDLQLDALKAAGCAKIFIEKASGAKDDRPELRKALEYIRDGEDNLVVWKLDRLSRSLKQLIETVTLLNQRTVGLRSLKEHIDTTTSTGKLIFHIFGALAEFERDVIRERTHAGLVAARARGRKGGRKKAIPTDKFTLALDLYNQKELSVDKICANLGINRRTFYNYLAEYRGKLSVV